MFWEKHQRQIKNAFYKIAGNDKLIDYSEWKTALEIRNDALTQRMFLLADTDQSSYIDRHEFESFATTLLSKDLNKRLKYVFKVCDMDDSGYVGRDELQKIISASLTEQGLTLTEEKIEELIACFFEHAAVKRKAGINEEEFVQLLASTPDVEKQFDSFIHKILNIKVSHKRKPLKGAGLFTRLKRRYLEKWKEHFWFTAYLFGNISLFYLAMQHYADIGANHAVQIARGAGACLNFNAALILLPMCKALLSSLRHSILYHLFPFDNLTEIHRTIAYAIIGFSLIHIGAHFYNYSLANVDLASTLLKTQVGISGLTLTFVLLLMWRGNKNRKQRYEQFTLIHLLYAPFLIALLFHGAVFWVWISPSLILYGLDALYRTIFKYRKVEITELCALSDRVTQVRFKRGSIFPFYPGDYVKVRIPSLASFQWHPFTLSAAPQSSRLDIHVRNNGDWSGALHNLANQTHPQRKKWTAYIDGPYSAPTSSIYRSKVAILIAGGIGVTPFASVLQSLLLNEKARKEAKAAEQIIHFHWLNRSQKSYEWFVDLLTQAEEQLGKERFHLNIHLTSMARNLSNLVMQLALNAYWEKYQQDPLTDLNARTSAGRPNWDTIFSQAVQTHKGKKIDVYFCGPKELGKSIQKMANKHGLHYREEKFE